MLTPFQKRKLTRYFNCLDTDANGFFEADDVARIAERLAAARGIDKGSEAYDEILAGVNMIWDNARTYSYSQDPNKVTLADWLHHEDVVLSTEESREGYMKKVTRDVFDLIDADGSGEIDIEEYAALMKAFGVEDGIPEWAFKHLDLDNSGVIERDEFVTIVEQFHMSEDLDAPGNYLFGPY